MATHETRPVPLIERRGIHSVETGSRVLEALAVATGPATLSTISELTDMPPSKVHRYLVSLVRCELVEQSESTGLYDLGPASLRLGVEANRRLDEGRVAGPYASSLRDRLGHSVDLVRWGDSGPTVIRWEYGRFPMHITTQAGGALSPWSSAGLVFLAYLPPMVTKPVIQRHLAAGNGGPEKLEDLGEHLEEIRANKICFVVDTPVLGVDGFSSPIFDADGQVQLTIGVVGPHSVLSGEMFDEVCDELLSAASAVSAELGYLGGKTAAPHLGPQ